MEDKMGLFDKKIQCTYCKKSVKEEYAKNVGICPHCSKRLALPSSNSLNSGDSNKINNKVNTPNRDVVYNSQANKAGKIVLLAILASFAIGFIGFTVGIISLFVDRSNESGDYNEYVYSNEYDNEDIDNDKGENNDNESETSFKLPKTEEMTSFLTGYFGKNASDIKYVDLCEIKGFSINYDYNLNEIYISVYENDDKKYNDFIENGFLDIEELNNDSKKYNIEISENTSAYDYMNEMLKDVSCFPNLEYFESNYSFSMYDYFVDCKNLKAFIAPRVSVYSDAFNGEMDIEYLSVFELGDVEVLDNLISLKSLRLNSDFEDVEENVAAVLEKCSKLDSLYVKKQIDESVFSKMKGIVNLDVQGITTLNNIPCYNTLETLTLRFSSIDDLSAISKYTKLTYLYICDNTIADYSSLASLSSLKALLLDPLNHDVMHNVSALSGLSNLEYLSVNGIYDTEFIKSLKNLKELELSHIYDDVVNDVVVTLPKLEKLTLDYIYTNETESFGYLSSIDNIREVTIKDTYIYSELTDLFITDSLEKISIDGCTFKADGSKLKENNSLIHLSITNCTFHEGYYDSNWEYKELEYNIDDFAASMDKFKGLKTLNMEGCGLTAAPKVVEGVEVKYEQK